MGEGGPGNSFKTQSLFAIGNRNKQATETNDKELFHECNIEKGKKFLLGGQPVFLFVNCFSCSCLLEFTVQFNKLSSETNKTHKIPNQHPPPSFRNHLVLGKVLCLQTGMLHWSYSDSLVATPSCTLTKLLGLSVFAFFIKSSNKRTTNTTANTTRYSPPPTARETRRSLVWVPMVPPWGPDSGYETLQKLSLHQFPNCQTGMIQKFPKTLPWQRTENLAAGLQWV